MTTHRTTHGDCKTRLYRTWSAMKSRCYNKNLPQFRYYGGKGIKMCDEWLDYRKFKEWAISSGYNDSLTIERNDGNKNYCPENCKWITLHDQTKNRSDTIFVDGLCLMDYCKNNGLAYQTIYKRLDRGYTLQRALSQPIRNYIK